MNKKLIAIAIATAMTAPVAMADVKISGRVAGHLTIFTHDVATNDSTGFGDAGQSRLQFDGTSGDAYARVAYDTRNGFGGAASAGRDIFVGYNLGGGTSIQFGRMGTAGKNLEKDQYIATFLQTRNGVAEAVTSKEFGSSSFVGHLIQAKMKAGAATITVQYDVADQAGAASGHEGHTAVSVAGKGGPVRYWASYNNGAANGTDGAATTSPSNIKVGAEMAFGKAKVALNYTSADNDTGAAGESNSIAVTGEIGMGNGLSMNAGFATKDNGGVDETWMRIAVAKKLNAGTMAYAGYTATTSDTPSSDTSTLGAGMIVKF